MRYLLFLWFICFLASCNRINETKKTTTERNNTFDTVFLTNAKCFSILQNTNSYKLSVTNSFKGNDNLYEYFLSKDSSEAIPNYIPIPVKKVICLSATHIGFIEALNKTEYIKGISGEQYIYHSEILKKIKAGDITDIGSEGNFDYEKIVSLKPGVVFAFGVDQKSLTYISKLQQLGINVVLVGEYMETTPLGRAEWIKFFSCFFDCLEEANTFFDNVKNQYLFLKDSINNIQHKIKPSVINGLPYNGTWYVPGGNSFMASLMKDAGADYSWVKNTETSGTPIPLEQIYKNAAQFDVWLNPDMATSLAEIKQFEPRAASFKAFKNKYVFNNTCRTTPSGGNDYWESGTVHPEIILKDLIHIFYPTLNDSLYYFKKLN